MKEDFRLQVLRFFKNGMYSSGIKRIPLPFEKFFVRRNAKRISEKYASMPPRATTREQKEVFIKSYTGSNPVALKIRDRLETAAGSKLVGAYVHGSIATSEEIAYSDFDGLIIVKNDCMKDPQLLADLFFTLKETERMMLDMDPLQHHGWFVLTEADLDAYPEHYFPAVILEEAATLFGANKIAFQHQAEEYTPSITSFSKLADSITIKLNSGSYLQNYYAFKNLLSECMLLPAIYLQSIGRANVSKKNSFGLIGQETGNVGSVMNAISELRQQWNYKPPAGYLERRKSGRLSDTYAAQSGQLPEALRQTFESEVAPAMKKFVEHLKKRKHSR